MLNISHYKIIAIGKIKKKWIKEGIEMYLNRLPGLKVIEIKDSTQTKEEYTIKELIKKNETEKSLASKVLLEEHVLYPKVLLNFSNQIIESVGAGSCT